MATDQTQYDLPKLLGELLNRVGALEKGVSGSAIPGLQILPNGTLFAQGGIAVGAGGPGAVIAEPTQVPLPSGLSLSWGSSFDTIYIDASWVAPEGYGADQVVSYLVQATKFGVGSVPIQATVGDTHVRLEPVEPNTTYTVIVSAITKTGKTSSVVQDTILTGGDTTAPAAPTFGASPVLAAVQALSIKWLANTERDVANGSGQYRVVVSTHSDLSSPAFDGKFGGTTAWVGGLTAGTSYYIGVYAIDSSGNQSTVGTPSGGPWVPATNVTDTSAIAAGGGNIVKNSGFEDTWHNNWTLSSNGSTFSQATDAHHGVFTDGNPAGPATHSLKITGTGDDYGYQDITLSKGTWIISAWVKGDSLSGTGRGAVMNCALQSGSWGLGTPVLGTTLLTGSSHVIIAGNGTFDWVRVGLKTTVTAEAVVRVFLTHGYGGSVSGTTWWDEVQAEQGDIISAYAPRPDEINAGSITGTMIGDDQIITRNIAANQITANEIAAHTIGALQILAHSITAGEIQADTITSTEIAAHTITASEIQSGTITGAEIHGGAITAFNIAADTITAQELSAISIVTGKYIQSANYVPNSTGWAIEGDGSAEFNNVYIRGVLNAAKFGADLFDFQRSNGSVGLRVWFTGSTDRLYIGNGMVNVDQRISYDNTDGEVRFESAGNSQSWRFTDRAVFDSIVMAYNSYSCGSWGSNAGYFISSDGIGNPDGHWGVAFGYDGASAYTAMLQGYIDSTQRHVGLANMTGGVQQFYIDATSGSGSDTRTLTRTGVITYSATQSKSSIKDLHKEIGSARDVINALQPKKYRVKTRDGGRYRLSERQHFGLLAEEVREVLPDLVHDELCFVLDKSKATESDWGPGIDYQGFIPVLVQLGQEQQEEISSLREQVRKLTDRMDERAGSNA